MSFMSPHRKWRWIESLWKEKFTPLHSLKDRIQSCLWPCALHSRLCNKSSHDNVTLHARLLCLSWNNLQNRRAIKIPCANSSQLMHCQTHKSHHGASGCKWYLIMYHIALCGNPTVYNKQYERSPLSESHILKLELETQWTLIVRLDNGSLPHLQWKQLCSADVKQNRIWGV